MDNQTFFGALSKHYKNQYKITHFQKYIKTVQKQCEITQFRGTLKTPQTPMHNHAFSVISQYTTKTVKNRSFSVHSRNTAKTYTKSHIFSDLSNTAKKLQHHTISMLPHSHWTSQTNATSRPQKQSQEKVCRRGRPRPLFTPKGGILIIYFPGWHQNIFSPKTSAKKYKEVWGRCNSMNSVQKQRC